MKTPKCPLCDGLFVLDNNLFQKIPVGSCYCLTTRVYIYKCSVCHLAAKYGETPKQARYYAEELISKFPPIMRVQEGDLIAFHTGNSIKIRKIQAIDKENCRLQTDIGIVYANAVFRWPWELEQEGDGE